jgi:hypothetical protein
MSYIVCSNQQYVYNKGNGNDLNGLSQPMSFRNFFKSPLIIEPNSEIAVQSIKLTKPTTSVHIKPDDHIFLYFGKEFNHDPASLYEQAQTPRSSVPVYFNEGVYNPQQFALELQRAINDAPLPPGLFGRTEVELETDPTDDTLLGYIITFNHIKSGTDKSSSYGTISATEGQVPALINASFDAEGYEWTTSGAGKPVFGPAVDTDHEYRAASILTKYPMANASTANSRSIIEFVITDAGAPFTRTNDTQWAVGLTRPLDGRFRKGTPKYSVIENTRFGYFDYFVYYDDLEGGIFVTEYNTQDDDVDSILRARDIEYFGAGRPFTSRIDATKINASNLDTIRFAIDGDKVKLEFGQSGGSFYDLVNPDNATLNAFKRGRFKPINNNTEALYPKVVFSGENRNTDCGIEIERFEVFDNDKFVYPNFHQAGSYSRGSDFATRYGANPAPNVRGFRNLGLVTDNRPATNAEGVDTKTFEYVTNVVSASGTIDYKHVIIQGVERAKDMSVKSGTTYTLQNQAPATMAKRLGFGDVSVLEQSKFGAYNNGKASFTPKVPPINTRQSMFVRVNNLPITSFNGTTNSISRILYAIPPYDNSGNDEGVVFHAPPEKTYIKLNNSEKLMLNELDTDIVDRNDQLVKQGDIIANTTITYHIRQSRDPISNQTQLF